MTSPWTDLLDALHSADVITREITVRELGDLHLTADHHAWTLVLALVARALADPDEEVARRAMVAVADLQARGRCPGSLEPLAPLRPWLPLAWLSAGTHRPVWDDLGAALLAIAEVLPDPARPNALALLRRLLDDARFTEDQARELGFALHGQAFHRLDLPLIGALTACVRRVELPGCDPGPYLASPFPEALALAALLEGPRPPPSAMAWPPGWFELPPEDRPRLPSPHERRCARCAHVHPRAVLLCARCGHGSFQDPNLPVPSPGPTLLPQDPPWLVRLRQLSRTSPATRTPRPPP